MLIECIISQSVFWRFYGKGKSSWYSSKRSFTLVCLLGYTKRVYNLSAELKTPLQCFLNLFTQLFTYICKNQGGLVKMNLNHKASA